MIGAVIVPDFKCYSNPEWLFEMSLSINKKAVFGVLGESGIFY